LLPPGEIPLRAFIRPIFYTDGAKTHPEAGTPVRVITRVTEFLIGWADEASLRHPHQVEAYKKSWRRAG